MPDPADWFVYIVQCADRSLYTGITTELLRRIEEHNSSPNGARYTRARRPVQLVYFECSDCRSTASQREHALKRLSPAAKRQLVVASARDCQQLLQGLYPEAPPITPLAG
ncbi:GIY-YIG nuclease family protein [Sulfuriflexus mobilis]|uniref:GIY-YIG nuclease family protein n=1 Tax=Sulfuriflexus mobilis TaxID=1811807 RepID=UPI000F83E956|nr:GIY-YIG nuclease family protein [Sulfuriflexus mobilis]